MSLPIIKGILDKQATYPFAQLATNYAPGFDLSKVPANDRIELEDK